jgi:pyruvate/2-oxoglutarate dehydrogenase complex dihydrolipoamide dehydrogenase (E3) component
VRQLKADIAVIGAGSGGLSVAAGAAQLGLKVVLFEKHKMGGDCLNYGCVPSKALISAAKAAHAVRMAGRFGVNAPAPTIAWDRVKAHIEKVIETIAPVDSQERFEGLGCTVIRDHARFADANTIESDNVRVKARRIVLATGSQAVLPPIPGLAEAPYLTNETIFSLQTLPQKLVILGAGPIGVELGQAFARLGSRVIIVEPARALARMDAEAASLAVAALRHEGVDLREGWKAIRVGGQAQALELVLNGPNGESETLTATHLLVAAGRAPVLEGLGLEAGGVAHDAKGVTVKPNLRSTTNPRVWAVGDATGKALLTHAAGWHASVFVRNALFKAHSTFAALPMPAVAYGDPEVGQIGLTEAEAKEQRGQAAVRVARWSFEDNDRAQAEGAPEGFAKIITDKAGTILGATVVGEGAGDLLQIVAVAMSNKLKIRALTNYIAPYPTRGEIIKRVAGQWYVPVLFSGRTKALVGLLQRIP